MLFLLFPLLFAKFDFFQPQYNKKNNFIQHNSKTFDKFLQRVLTQKLSRHILDIVSEKSYSQSEVNEMDGSHSKDTIPLEPEGYRRSEKNFTVHFGQLFWIQQS